MSRTHATRDCHWNIAAGVIPVLLSLFASFLIDAGFPAGSGDPESDDGGEADGVTYHG
jgi:hypothetical protein